ncbi:hypothetical protein LTR84_010625 [Exophiala bonariae]|uniref:AAA+ ATPase domain-containing protein n=1 Tax=Exophiala bonariae TaxID=1690606 RepID=A0AAV9MVR6_9EURO|nr:hypothetical protein LTR84_010625 [Exophiala bonariae]
MHPFFRKERTDHDSDTHSPSQAAGPLSIDGALEEKTTIAEAMNPDNMVDRSQSHPTVSPEKSRTVALSSRSSWNPTQPVKYTYHENIYHDIMPDNAGTKRRKTSQGHEYVVPVAENTLTGSETWHEQLTRAASSTASRQTSEQGQIHDGFDSQPIGTSQDPSNASESTTERSVDLETQQHLNLHQSLTSLPHPSQSPSEKDPIIDPSLTSPTTAPDSAMDTPRNKSVRLGAIGKLINSPKHAQKTSPAMRNTKRTKTPSRARKVEMKNGKFVSSLRITLPYASPDTGKKINEILSFKTLSLNQSSTQTLRETKKASSAGTKIVHPFFLNKPLTPMVSRAASEAASACPVSEDESRVILKAPTPWKDIIFGSRNTSQKSLPGLDPIWPPNALHNIQPEERLWLPSKTIPQATIKSKSKHIVPSVDCAEDVLSTFGGQLRRDLIQPPDSVHLPTRLIMSGKSLFESLTLDSLVKPVANMLQSRIESKPTAFDQGRASGPCLWPQAYAPERWEEVLQPQAYVLHDWLRTLEVHNVQSGNTQSKPKIAMQKKRRKRKTDELDDFIAHSDDDADNDSLSPKNAILLTGPSGCGKTASVYAVAQQLGFEIFEIYPGMRRNARDIMDQVGDMTKNHLVQRTTGISSRRSSVSASDNESCPALPVNLPPNQQTMAAFMGNGTKNKKPGLAGVEANKGGKAKSQKQSLILFEEVDILFEEDKGFWSAVQTLIQASKRPVILTCNDPTSVPVDDLNLYATLEYENPSTEVAVQYLRSVAASEGHLLSSQAIQNLYVSKGYDLRASLTELNFWCQMTVGSQLGGIDWMMPYNERHATSFPGSITRIVSKDTFISGHDLLPTETRNSDDLIGFAMEHLGMSALDWVDQDVERSQHATVLQRLDDLFSLCEARSSMDVLDDTISPLLAAKIKQNSPSTTRIRPREQLVERHLAPRRLQLSSRDILEIFGSLTEENRIGLPQPPGRKAPSLDSSAVSVATEIAPYIRQIVLYDQRLAVLRNDLDGGSQSSSNKRQRRTRAARAALEGGTIASTRRDRWFTDALDLDAVLSTAGGWPQAQLLQPQESIGETESLGTPSSTASVHSFE